MNLPLSEIYDRETLALYPDEKLAEIIGSVGIDLDSTIALYDSYDGQSAAMLAWLLEYLGHPRVVILSNYLESWVKHGGQILYRPVPTHPTILSQKPSRAARANVNEVLQRRDAKLLDLRGEDEFQGKTSTEPRSGRIPGAINLPWTKLIGENSQFLKSQSDLKGIFAEIGLDHSDEIITYCSNGPRAAIGYVALQQLDFRNVRVYDGSFHEWARNPNLPLEQASISTHSPAEPPQPSSSPCIVESLPGL